ncbi:MAG: hypothetical protein LAP21_08310 [Acidobacteriia bacterium]|nr:hypothetical protein [Terriglobia bacterium]
MEQTTTERTPCEAAEAIRKCSSVQQRQLDEALKAAGANPLALATTFVRAVAWGVSWLAEIAAQLTESNSRDSAAEIRARDAEGFVAGIQAEIARQQEPGLVLPVTNMAVSSSSKK